MEKSTLRKFIAEPDFSPQTFGERLTAGFLGLLSVFYRWGVNFRNGAYLRGIFRARRLPRPVVSVGNLTVGGTGKTPLAAWLARYFQEQGFKPCILSRGYGRRDENEILMIEGGKGSFDYKKTGDEPALLARKLPGTVIALGSNRYAAAKAALGKFPLDLFILDDGFQHQKLRRDLNILLLDADNPWGNGHLFPRGSLRESRESLGRADLIILTKAQREKDYEKLKDEVRRWNRKAPVLTAGYKSRSFSQIGGAAELTPDELYDKNILALAGLAQPQSFINNLNLLGAHIIKFMTYPDHYAYTEKDVDEIAKTAEALEADFIVTTEKDAVRLEGLALPLPFWSLGIEMDFFADRKILEVLLNNLLVSRDEK